MQDGGAGGSLTKIGSGTLTLTGMDNFSGDMKVNEGALRLESGGSLSNRFGYVGGPAGSNGTTVVDEPGTVWNNQFSLFVGDFGIEHS